MNNPVSQWLKTTKFVSHLPCMFIAGQLGAALCAASPRDQTLWSMDHLGGSRRRQSGELHAHWLLKLMPESDTGHFYSQDKANHVAAPSFRSYETGYSIQCALQLVRKHKHFLKGWLSVCNLLLASVGPQLNRRAKRHGVSQTARRLNSVNSFLLLGFSFITHASELFYMMSIHTVITLAWPVLQSPRKMTLGLKWKSPVF
ncbi:PREDICTED: uncharacterized protein LOC107540696 [Miniopterus natalensis]|uniref:uncharacterized protein LOC107540696 n=1 Tax=Miniopterus natalensis TaxID=291302 RepID=UPI0007A70A9D|nr:PREDICTED: uncharacterized protein LOC107540696 [Miniopterus natalensis]